MVSMANCAPPQRGRPVATTSRRLCRRRSLRQLTSCWRRPGRRLPGARSRAHPRLRRMPERAQAARWSQSWVQTAMAPACARRESQGHAEAAGRRVRKDVEKARDGWRGRMVSQRLAWSPLWGSRSDWEAGSEVARRRTHTCPVIVKAAGRCQPHRRGRRLPRQVRGRRGAAPRSRLCQAGGSKPLSPRTAAEAAAACRDGAGCDGASRWPVRSSAVAGR